MNMGLTKNKIAGAAVTKRRIVKFGATPQNVVQAAAGTDLLIGVSAEIDAAITEPCDVYLSGIVPVEAGAAVAAGKFVTSDANGKAIEAIDKNYVVGQAMCAAAADGDVIEIRIAPGTASV